MIIKRVFGELIALHVQLGNTEKAEVLKKYNLKGDKNDLHLPYVDRMFRGKMMIKN